MLQTGLVESHRILRPRLKGKADTEGQHCVKWLNESWEMQGKDEHLPLATSYDNGRDLPPRLPDRISRVCCWRNFYTFCWRNRRASVIVIDGDGWNASANTMIRGVMGPTRQPSFRRALISVVGNRTTEGGRKSCRRNVVIASKVCAR